MRVAPTIAFVVSIATPALAAITVQPSRTTFNPSLHESVTYTVQADSPGTLSAVIVDRDLFVTKTLARAQRVIAGTTTLTWDGTDAEGRTVADEAWSLKLDLQTASGTETYFPALSPAEMVAIKPDMYDVRTGVLRYTLPLPSRVHLQAGVADRTSKDQRAGAVMKTIVNRAPRPAGAVVEQWMGMDESNTVYVPALPNFVCSIAATPLPEGAVISYGNRSRDFVREAVSRSGHPLIVHRKPQMHHGALTTLDDISPRMTAAVTNASWRPVEKAWVTRSRSIKVAVGLNGPTAKYFRKQPGHLIVYLDQQRVFDDVASPQPITIKLPANTAPHIVALNWASEYGPVAATAFRIERTN